MNLARTVFSQLIAFLPDRQFRRCVAHYSGDHTVVVTSPGSLQHYPAALRRVRY